MYIDQNSFINWIEKEFNAKKLPNKESEWIINCPFCDNNENHFDFGINVEKGVMNCWRGFDSRCESGLSIVTFVALYYNISISEAIEFIKKNFLGENSIQRIKKRLKKIEQFRILSIDEKKISWSFPNEVEQIVNPVSKGGEKALDWLLNIRQIPFEFVELLNPVYLSKFCNVRWKKYSNRVFFPVESFDRKAWLAYSTKLKSTKDNPKTMNPPGSILSSMFFLYNYYIDSNKPIILCEGLFDALRMFIFGYNAVAGFGTTLSIEQIGLLNELKTNEVIVCYDPDATQFKLDKKGKKTSKAFKVSDVLHNYFFGSVSVMILKREDPDRSTYREIKDAYRNRLRYKKQLWRVNKLAVGLKNNVR